MTEQATDCEINPESARVCERGTLRCIMHHDEPPKAVVCRVWRHWKTGGLVRLLYVAQTLPGLQSWVIFTDGQTPEDYRALPSDTFHDGRYEPLWNEP